MVVTGFFAQGVYFAWRCIVTKMIHTCRSILYVSVNSFINAMYILYEHVTCVILSHQYSPLTNVNNILHMSCVLSRLLAEH